jgi:hypothetical protein
MAPNALKAENTCMGSSIMSRISAVARSLLAVFGGTTCHVTVSAKAVICLAGAA